MHRIIAIFLTAAGMLVAVAPQDGAAQTAAQAPIAYRMSFDNAEHHEARIAVTFSGIPAGQPLEAVMSRSSPGRYAIHDFAKNVYDVSATDGAGRPLTVSRVTPHEWRVAGHDGTVVLSYTLYGDRADGTYTAIDLTHAHLNMPATFMWARGLEERPIRVAFDLLPGWKVATQLRPTSDPTVYTSPDLQYFLDSPTELSDFELREWKAGDRDQYTIRLAVHSLADDSIIDRYARMAERVVDEEAAVFGSYPEFDFGTYTFIADYLPWASGDGMEHRNSTILSSSRTLSGNSVNALLGTLVHEAFHAWNMERLRDAALEPFNFESSNISRNLWFGEGFTSYYTPLIPTRAGYTTLDTYARGLGGAINAVVNGAGRGLKAPVQMSEYATFADAAVSNDPVNRANTFISYYTYGSAIGLGLDLTLRTRFDKSLDGYMRALWLKYGRHQEDLTPTRPYTTEDLRATLAEYTGDEAFARDFFDRYIYGRDVVDYAPLLAQAGLLLRQSSAGQADIGNAGFQFDSTGATMMSQAVRGTALYDAGVDNGDRIIELDGQRVTSAADIARIESAHRPGDEVAIRYEQRGQVRTERLVFKENRSLEVVTYEAAGLPVTAGMAALRTAWLGSQLD